MTGSIAEAASITSGCTRIRNLGRDADHTRSKALVESFLEDCKAEEGDHIQV